MADDYFAPLGDVQTLNNNIFLAMNRVYVKALTERTPFRTGNVAALWELQNPEPFIFEFVNEEGVIVMVLEEGSKEHIISAKNKKYLKFKAKPRVSPYNPIPGNRAFLKNGYVYAKMVRHPVFAGRHFIKGVFEDEGLYKEFQETFVELMQSGR